MVKVNVKWGKEKFEGIDLDPSQTVETFKALLMSMTGVPIARQKLMAKGAWKGMLKDDADFSTMKFKEGHQIMLMGTAEVAVEPQEKTIFVEDLTTEEKALKGAIIPAGFDNLGNTCYMNSALQCLRFVPELRAHLNAAPGTIGLSPDPDTNLTLALRDTFQKADSVTDSMPPMEFVAILRQAFPTFAEQGPRGGYMQQDSEEFLNTLFSCLNNSLKDPLPAIEAAPAGGGDKEKQAGTRVDGQSGLSTFGTQSGLIQALFGLDIEETYTCAEDAAEVSKTQTKAFKLVCNIQGGAGSDVSISHMHEGVMLGLTGEVEKRSETLGRDSVFKKESRVKRLPRMLCVQFMRFFWKATPDSQDHAGVKCKMLKPVSIPMKLDSFDFCSDSLKAVLKVQRDRHADEILTEFDKKDKARKAEMDAMVEDGKKARTGDEEMSDASAAPAPAAAAGGVDAMETEEDEALKAALAMSQGEEVAAPGATAGIGMPPTFMGNYELFGLVTHKGRSADSGHYMGWVREHEGGDDWLCFDDSNVEPCKTEHIMDLKGGGDYDMAYLAFYRYMNE